MPASPWRLGGLTPLDLGRRVYRRLWRDQLVDHAAALSYYFLFALFPTLLFLTTLLGLLPVEGLRDRLVRYGDQMLPPDAASLLWKTVDEVTAGAGGGLLSLGALGALWGASRGTRSVIAALNIVFDVDRPRPWWRRQLVAVTLTAALTGFTLAALLLLVFGDWLRRLLTSLLGLDGAFELAWALAQGPLAVLLLLVGLDLTYRLAPATAPRWPCPTPGAVLALLAWIGTSLGLRAYVTHFSAYNATYGSIGAVILLMLWLYLSSLALLLGGLVNSVIAREASRGPDWPHTIP